MILCTVHVGFAQEPTVVDGYLLDKWDIEDGLPANSVVDIIQSENGYLWLVTFNGLVRFDGLRKKVYQTDNYPSMPTNRNRSILESDDGIIWLYSEHGYLIKLENDTFTRIDSENGLKGDLINSMTKDNEGTLWFATDEGITTYSEGVFTHPAEKSLQSSVGKVFPFAEDEFWFINKDFTQIFRHSNEKLTPFKQFSSKSTYIQSILKAPNQTVYFAVGDSVYYYLNDTLHFHSVLEGNIGGGAAIYVRNDGMLWANTTSSGVFNYVDNEWKVLPNSIHQRTIARNYFHEQDNDFWVINERAVWRNEQQIASIPNGIYSFLFDYEGNLWIGTMADGVLRIKENPFKTITTEDGLPANNVYGIFEDNEQHIWIGTHGYGAAQLKNYEVIRTPIALSSTTGGYFKGFYQTKDSTIFAGSLGTSVLKIKSTDSDFPFSEYKGEDVPYDINAFYEDYEGNLWAGGGNGLFLFSAKNWSPIKNYEGAEFAIKYFQPAPNQSSFWIATNGAGLLYNRNGSITQFNKNNGFLTNHIRSLHIQKGAKQNNYILWIGSQDIGLIRLEVIDNSPVLETITSYSTRDGLIDHTIHVIIEDEDENLWMNTNQGIYRTSIQDLEEVHRGLKKKLDGVGYNELDGLVNREGNGGVQPAGIRASDGMIWMASQEGAVVFNPRTLTNTNPPNVVIDELNSNKRANAITQNSILLHNNERDFEVSFTALSLTSPEKNKFKYRLVGFNDEWQEADVLRKAIYTNIPNGEYTFEVLASNNSGIWTKTPATLKIEIQPYFYETAWFSLLGIALFAFLVFSFIQWRLSALRKNELQLKKEVEERTKELLAEKKITEAQTLRLQELDKVKSKLFANISHELKTPLTLIIGPLKKLLSSDLPSDSPINNELERMLRNSDRLLRLVDQTLEISKIEHGTIRLQVQPFPLIPFLENLIKIFSEIAYNEEILLSLHTQTLQEPALIYGDQDKLEIIIANLLSNAIKFTPKQGQITVTCFLDDDAYCIEVSDTGIGIPNSELEAIFDRFYQVDSSETRNHEGTGIGLSLAKEFAILHKGTLTVHAQPNVGSTFSLRLLTGFKHFASADIVQKRTNTPTLETQSSPGFTSRVSEQEIYPDTKKLLIVEDNLDLQHFLSEIFHSHFHIVTASNGSEALEKVGTVLPDIIIADVMMPVMDGFSFNRALKKDPQTAHIPLLFLTAKGQKDSELQGLSDGADAYISKPFDPDLLFSRVQNLLETRMRLRTYLAEHTEDNKPVATETDPFLMKVNKQLSVHFSDPSFNVQQLSNALFMDRSQLLRLIKSASGLTPSEYLKKYRMEKAKSMLKSGDGTISEVAYATGFNSLSYFSYSFKEFYNQAPSEFLQTLSEN